MRIGIDLGGTKIEAVAIDDQGVEHFRRRVPTPRDDFAGTVQAIADLVAAVEGLIGTRATVGVGTPGAISPASGLIKNANSVWLNGQPLDRALAAALDRPVRLANDANCLALSESVDGAGIGAAVVFGAILGTGVGGGVVVDRRVLTGRNAIAGEWGHSPLPWPTDEERPGPACYCGRHGCIETFCSGPALARAYARRSRIDCSGQEVAARAATDAHAEAALVEYEERLARSLATVINLLDPEVIVLGGGCSNIDRLYTTVPRLWTPFVFSDRVDTSLVKARHGDSSGVRGAAWLWPKR